MQGRLQEHMLVQVLGKIYGDGRYQPVFAALLQIAGGVGSLKNRHKTTFCIWTGWAGHGNPWAWLAEVPSCSSHGPPGQAVSPAATVAHGRGQWSQSLQNMQYFMCNFSPCWLCLVPMEGTVSRKKFGDCRCWGIAGKPVIYGNWTWQHSQENTPLLPGCAVDLYKLKNNTCLGDCPVSYSQHGKKHASHTARPHSFPHRPV